MPLLNSKRTDRGGAAREREAAVAAEPVGAKIESKLKLESEFIANGDPAVVEVVAASKDLEIVAIGHESLCNLVNLLWFLTLAAPLAEDHIAFNVESGLLVNVAFDTHEAGLLGVLEIIAVPLGYLPVHSLLHPRDLVHKPIDRMS